MKRTACLTALCLWTAFLASGCGVPINITQYPSWYDPTDPSTHVKSLAVLPFRNRAPRAKNDNAGESVAEELAGLLQRSGTYGNVYNRANLEAMLSEQDLKIALGSGSTQSMSTVFRKMANVEAFLTGAVTGYSSDSKTTTQRIPQYITNFKTGQRRFVGYQTITTIHNSANVTVTATLSRASNGSSIHDTGPITQPFRSSGTSPRYSEAGCLAQAKLTAVGSMLAQFGIVRKTIEVSGDALQTAVSKHDGKWKKSGKFKTSDPKLYAVLTLPDSCEHNMFQVKIAHSKDGPALATRTVRWKKGYSRTGLGLEFSPRKLGPGKYVAKFYPGVGEDVQPKLFSKFKIEAK